MYISQDGIYQGLGEFEGNYWKIRLTFMLSGTRHESKVSVLTLS